MQLSCLMVRHKVLEEHLSENVHVDLVFVVGGRGTVTFQQLFAAGPGGLYIVIQVQTALLCTVLCKFHISSLPPHNT